MCIAFNWKNNICSAGQLYIFPFHKDHFWQEDNSFLSLFIPLCIATCMLLRECSFSVPSVLSWSLSRSLSSNLNPSLGPSFGSNLNPTLGPSFDPHSWSLSRSLSWSLSLSLSPSLCLSLSTSVCPSVKLIHAYYLLYPSVCLLLTFLVISYFL